MKTYQHPRIRLARLLVVFVSMLLSVGFTCWWISSTIGDVDGFAAIAQEVVEKPATRETLETSLAEGVVEAFNDAGLIIGDTDAADATAEQVRETVTIMYDNDAVVGELASALTGAHRAMVTGQRPDIIIADSDVMTAALADSANEAGINREAEATLRNLDWSVVISTDNLPDSSSTFAMLSFLTAFCFGAALFLSAAALWVSVDRGAVLAHLGRVLLRAAVFTAAIYGVIGWVILDGRKSTWSEIVVSLIQHNAVILFAVCAVAGVSGLIAWRAGAAMSERSPWSGGDKKVVITDWNADKTDWNRNAASIWLHGHDEEDGDDDFDVSGPPKVGVN